MAFQLYIVGVLNDFGNIRDVNAVQYLIYHKIHVDVFILQSIIPSPLFFINLMQLVLVLDSILHKSASCQFELKTHC